MPGMQTSTPDASEHGFPRAALVPLALSLGGLACGVASILASASGTWVSDLPTISILYRCQHFKLGLFDGSDDCLSAQIA